MKLILPKEWYEKNLPHDNQEVAAGNPAKMFEQVQPSETPEFPAQGNPAEGINRPAASPDSSE